MADREKVIKAIECRKNAHKRCGNPCEMTGLCAYASQVRSPDGEPYYPFYCDTERLCDDVLALLRQDESVTLKPEELLKEHEPVTMKPYYFNYVCSGCGSEIDGEFIDYTGGKIKFCPYCGKAVKWE